MVRWMAGGGGAAAAVVTAVLVAACGSGATSSATVTTTSPATATTSVTTGAATATTSVTSGAATATTSVTTGAATATATTSAGRAPRARTAAVAPGCTPAHTAVSVGRTGAATGHVGITLLFRDRGAQPCTLTGYPGAALVAAGGRHRRLDIARTPQGFLGGLSPQARANPVVRLAPGDFASAILEGEDVNPRTSAACPRYSALLVTPPNQTVTLRLTRSLAICAPEIHPVVAGTSGRQRTSGGAQP